MSATSNADIILTHSTVEDIVIEAFDTDGDDETMVVTALDKDLADSTTAAGSRTITLDDSAATKAFEAQIVGQLEVNSHKAFTVTAGDTTATQGFFDTTSSNVGGLSAVSAISLGTAANAESAITVIDGAINKINQSRADLGAISNRLDSTISNLTNVATNVEGSMSNIRDADFSIETSKLTRAQILTQAATSMLAQANTSKQSILALLQG